MNYTFRQAAVIYDALILFRALQQFTIDSLEATRDERAAAREQLVIIDELLSET